MTEFPIPKITGTHADALAAAGLADLLESAEIRCTLVDSGSEYIVRSHEPVTAGALRRSGLNAGFDYLVANEKERPKLPTVLASHFFDYPVEKDRSKRYREAQKAARAAGGEVAESIATQEPHPQFGHYMILNVLQGDGPLNKTAAWIAVQDPQDWARKLESALSDLASRRTAKFDSDSGMVQLFNPQAAKGYARLKPDTTSRNDSTIDAWADPLLEWLRFRGYFRATFPLLVGDDARVYCAEPKRISFHRLKTAMSRLRDEPIYGASPKVDCLGTLAIAFALVETAADFPDEDGEPADLLSAVAITHYKSLGQAKAVTGISRLAVPGWFPLGTPADVANWRNALNEYRLRLRRLDDSISDELQLLVLFRRYLEHRGPETLARLAEFHESYGVYLVRKRGQNKWQLPQFTVSILENIMSRESPYSDILRNNGFQAIARALRSSTVSAQARKKNSLDFREIRYDILPELRRKRSLPSPDAFLDTLSEFLASYNAESAKRLEQGKGSGTGRVSESDFADFVALYDKAKSPSLIGSLLCAFATCKVSQALESEESPTSAEDQE
jgi:hypothetical protein